MATVSVLTTPTLPNGFARTTQHIKRRVDLYQVENHSSLDLDSQSFQFQAAAAGQIFPLLSIGDVTFQQPSSLLATSPYIIREHLLDLNRLPDIQDRIVALALTKLTPTRPDYATAGYEEGLSWNEVRSTIGYLTDAAQHTWRGRDYYVVIFRSKLRPDFEAPLLWELDRESHREAVESGGLLKYWFGSTDSQNRNMATCVWRNREDAKAGGTGPWHRKARADGGKLYERISFETWKMSISDDAEALTFEQWQH